MADITKDYDENGAVEQAVDDVYEAAQRIEEKTFHKDVISAEEIMRVYRSLTVMFSTKETRDVWLALQKKNIEAKGDNEWLIRCTDTDHGDKKFEARVIMQLDYAKDLK